MCGGHCKLRKAAKVVPWSVDGCHPEGCLASCDPAVVLFDCARSLAQPRFVNGGSSMLTHESTHTALCVKVVNFIFGFYVQFCMPAWQSVLQILVFLYTDKATSLLKRSFQIGVFSFFFADEVFTFKFVSVVVLIIRHLTDSKSWLP